ncbi:MAG: hypothetical protein ACFFFB_23040 [Candidatus Heimdallarchaeota archaeon]
MSTLDDKVSRKINFVKNILNNVYEILELFKPLLETMLEFEEAEQYKKNGVFEKAASLFGEISSLCKAIENDSSSLNILLDNLGN